MKTPEVSECAGREKGMNDSCEFTLIEAGKTQEEILNNYIQALEAIVKRYPQQWFNFFNIWQQESR